MVSASGALKWIVRVWNEIVDEWIRFFTFKERPQRAELPDEEEADNEAIPPGGALSQEPPEGLLTQKGFEEHVLGLFDPAEFEVLNHANGDWVLEGSPMPLDAKDLGPDLIIMQRRTGIRFGIVPRLVRKGNHLEQIEVLEGFRRKRLAKYSRIFRVPCFVAMGAGMAKVDWLALIPLESVPAEGMGSREIAEFDRDPGRPITFMELAELSALCNELATEKQEGAAVPKP